MLDAVQQNPSTSKLLIFACLLQNICGTCSITEKKLHFNKGEKIFYSKNLLNTNAPQLDATWINISRYDIIFLLHAPRHYYSANAYTGINGCDTRSLFIHMRRLQFCYIISLRKRTILRIIYFTKLLKQNYL